MKRKSLYISFVSLVLILISMVMLGITYGWLADVIDLNSGIISVGDLRYTKSGAFVSDSPTPIIYPGFEFVDTALSVNNQSPIESQLRVEIEYTKITNPLGVLTTETVSYTNAVDDHLSVTFDSTFVNSGDYWYYNTTDYVVLVTSGAINIISSIYYDGDLTGNDYNNASVTVTVTIEVKQSDNVTWAELTSYDFSTGYPA